MIAEMLKYTFLVYHRQYDDFLENLRSVGVVHIAELQEGVKDNDVLRDKLQLVARIDKLIKDAQRLLPENATPKPSGQYDEAELVTELDQMKSEASAFEQKIAHLQAEAKRMLPWGYFDTQKIAMLRDAGYFVQCFQCGTDKYKDEWEKQFNTFKIGVDGKIQLFVAVNRQEVEIEGATVVNLNDKTSEQLTHQVEVEQQELAILQSNMATWAVDNINNLIDLRRKVQTDADWVNAHLCSLSAADDKVRLLEGFCPVDKAEDLNAMLQEKGVYYEARTATEDDKAPIKLQNNWFSKMFEPLTGMYGWPVYGEFDPTPIIAPFFLFFFALCMGDAGYGILLMLFGYLTLKEKIKIEMFEGLGPIIIALGIGTFFVGIGLGTFFGIDMTQASWTPEWLKSCMIASDSTIAGYDAKMVLSICIGVFHISLAMIIKAVIYTRRFGWKRNISTWSWLILILGALITGIMMITNIFSVETTRLVLIVLGAVSALGIYIFNTPGRNPLVNFGSGLWDTYNMATGLLGDVLSYVRLYALGLAGGMLGAAFNTLGLMVLSDTPNVGKWIGFIVILIIGHLLNLCMSALGAYVHPLRLTFVEFFKNTGYEGKGKKYQPFAVK